MADNRKYVQGQDFFLSGSGCTSTDTSITLTSMKFPDGTNITTSDIGSLAYGTLEPERSREENISFTGITQNPNGTATLTGVTRGLKFKDPYDQDISLRQPHAGGTTFRITNSVTFYSEFANKNNDETIAETWTFTDPNVPRMDTAHSYAGGEEEYFATKRYVDSVAISGAPDASTTTKGITKLSTAPASPTDPIAVGDNDPRLTPDSGTLGSSNRIVSQEGFQKGQEIYGASSAGSDAYVIALTPVLASYTDGQRLFFKADVGNTGASTLDAGPGAKDLVKGVTLPLSTGDIVANGVYEVVYSAGNDNFQVVSAIGEGSISSNIFTAKGDLLSSSAASTPEILPVGATQGMTLHVDSGASTGLVWGDFFASGYDATLNTGTSGNNDLVINCGFRPKIIELSFFLRGNDAATGTNNPIYTLGTATWIGTTFGCGFLTTSNTSSASTPPPYTPLSTGTAGDIAAGVSSGIGAIRVILSIDSVSDTGFTIRRLTTQNNTPTNNAIAQIGWKAIG